MIIPCDLVLRDCLPCNDDPIVNITAEAPDRDIFIGFRDFRGVPPLGVMFTQLGCKAICFSTVSQREADLCAERDAQACVWNTWRNPLTPPIPPGPDGDTHGFNTPGGIPPPPGSGTRNRTPNFTNRLQTCDVSCPDGEVFTEVVGAGEVRALNQDEADQKARSLACKFALQDRICIITSSLPASCVNQAYSAQLEAEGGFPFANQQYEWEIVGGELPPGLDIDFITGAITGTITASGSYTFAVGVTDGLGTTQVKDFTICVMEIISPAVLPQASDGVAYNQPLIQEPATVSSEVWTVVSGTLPDGLHLNSNGSISGTPTVIDVFNFTLRCVANCGGSSTSCTKSFSLEVISAVDCMGKPNAVDDIGPWAQISPPAAGSITMVSGDGTFAGVDPGNPFVEARCQLCNPKTSSYDITVTVDWTVAGFVAFITTQAIFRLNGVDHASPVSFANGTYHFTVTLPLPSGVNTLNIYCTAGGLFVGTLNGTATVRPLTPP